MRLFSEGLNDRSTISVCGVFLPDVIYFHSFTKSRVISELEKFIQCGECIWEAINIFRY